MDILALYLVRLIVIFGVSILLFNYVLSQTDELFIATAVGVTLGILLIFTIPAPSGGRFDL